MELYDSRRRRRLCAPHAAVRWTAVLLTLVGTAAGGGPATKAAGPGATSGLAVPTSIRFVDVTREVGVDFVHFAGRTEFKYLPETMGAGVGWFDYDGDGRFDLYFVDSGVLEGTAPTRTPPPDAGRNRLYRGAPGARFVRVPASGAEDVGYGMGVAFGDYDADGWPDLFVANYGANALYRNNGDGTFTDVTGQLGVDDPLWGTSAAWGDLDLDGLPELFVANYLQYEMPNPRVCGDVARGLRDYCTPDMFEGTPDLLYANRGGVRLEEVGEHAGVVDPADGKGLAVLIADLNADALPDLYVANDGTRNFLYTNRGALRLQDESLLSGTAVNAEGYSQSGMGVDVADLDGDGLFELAVSNYEMQAINVYRSLAPGLFQDATFDWGAGEATFRTLGFGLVFCDLDGDADDDLVIANGHVMDTKPSFAQVNQVLANRRAERFAARAQGPTDAGVGDARGTGHPASVTTARSLLDEVTASAGAPFDRRRVSRGLAYADLEGDGWPDLVVTNLDGPAEVLRNAAARDANRLVLRLRGRRSERAATGARVVVVADPTGGDAPYEQHFSVRSSSSYLSQGSSDLYVGVGRAERAKVQVVWPGGNVEEYGELDAGSLYLLVEGRGVAARRALVDGTGAR